MATDGGRLSPDGREVVYHVEPGEPILGLWCETCLLPSVVSVPVLLLTDSGVSDLGFAEQCARCGAKRRIC
jgi:hypothetical protein